MFNISPKHANITRVTVTHIGVLKSQMVPPLVGMFGSIFLPIKWFESPSKCNTQKAPCSQIWIMPRPEFPFSCKPWFHLCIYFMGTGFGSVEHVSEFGRCSKSFRVVPQFPSLTIGSQGTCGKARWIPNERGKKNEMMWKRLAYIRASSSKIHVHVKKRQWSSCCQ